MIRQFLSKPFGQRIGVYNGVAVRDVDLISDRPDHEPSYKRALAKAAVDASNPGDSVCVVGGGRGVVPTILSRQGRDVSVFEAAAEMVERLHETKRLNGVDFGVTHAVVGDPQEVYGDASEAQHMRSDELAGDVLVLDCEGSELTILPVDSFDSVVVETHPQFDAPTSAVCGRLSGAAVVGTDELDGEVVVA